MYVLGRRHVCTCDHSRVYSRFYQRSNILKMYEYSQTRLFQREQSRVRAPHCVSASRTRHLTYYIGEESITITTSGYTNCIAKPKPNQKPNPIR